MCCQEGLSLLLLLAYITAAQSKTANRRNGPPTLSLKQHHHHTHHHVHNFEKNHHHHRPQRHLQRQTRALSEFLVPPPVPTNFRNPRGPPPSLPQTRQKNHQPPLPLSPPPHHTRTGRYVNPHQGPNYIGKLMNWFNPFNNAGDSPEMKDNKQPQATSVSAQYAPHQPYTGATGQYEQPAHPNNLQNGYSGLAAWISGKPCNPCNQVPWIPVVHNAFNSQPIEIAPNVGGNAYSAPPLNQEFSHSGHGNQQNHLNSDPHLYSSAVPPLYNAKPFHDAPRNLNQPPSPNFDHQSQTNFDHPPPPNFEHQETQNIDHHSELTFDYQLPTDFNNQPTTNYNNQPPTNYNNQPTQNENHQSQLFFDQQPTLNSDHPPPTNIHQQPPLIFDHPSPANFDQQSPSNYDHPTSTNFNQQPPSNFDHQSNFGHKQQSNFNNQQQPDNDDQPSLNFDQQTPSNYDQQPQSNFDHHPQQNFNNQQQTNINNQQPINYVQPPSNYNPHQQQQPNLNGHASPNFDSDQPSNFDYQSPSYEDHSPSNIEQHHQPSQIVKVVEEAPSDIKNSNVDQNREESHQISTTTIIPNVHFQRSPLIDLSIAGESSTTTTIMPIYRHTTDYPTVTKGKATATLIDYIVSGPDETYTSSEEEKETTPRTIKTTTTKTITTTLRSRDRDQESMIDTIAKSYEFFKRKNESRINETKNSGRFMNEGEDSSASREINVPSKTDNGKKIIQIIIPYTSQYTPSPFHPTKSVDGHIKKPTKTEKKQPQKFEETTQSIDIKIDEIDNVVIEESRRVSVTRSPELKSRNNNTTNVGNTIDVHRLQKNIDNWTIQEYSKSWMTLKNSSNSTYPRWLSSKQIPDEYLVTNIEFEDSEEYYDFKNDTKPLRGTNRTQEPTKQPESTTKVNIINATYPKNPKKPTYLPKAPNTKSSDSSERVYVVTPIPNPNKLDKDEKRRKPKDTESVERAYQVLPQAVNNLAVVSGTPESAAPALWGIMEHEEIASGADQPRWRSESDVLPDPPSTPILYAGHSKVSRAR